MNLKAIMIFSIVLVFSTQAFCWGSNNVLEVPKIKVKIINQTTYSNDSFQVNLDANCASEPWWLPDMSEGDDAIIVSNPLIKTCIDNTYNFDLFHLSESFTQNGEAQLMGINIPLRRSGYIQYDLSLSLIKNNGDVYAPETWLENGNKLSRKALEKSVGAISGRTYRVVNLASNVIHSDKLLAVAKLVDPENYPYATFSVEVIFSKTIDFKKPIFLYQDYLVNTKDILKDNGDLTISESFPKVMTEEEMSGGYLKIILGSHNPSMTASFVSMEKIAAFKFNKGQWPKELNGNIDFQIKTNH